MSEFSSVAAGTFHPGVIDTLADIVHRSTAGYTGGMGEQEADELSFYHVFRGEAGFLFHHTQYYLCQFGGAFAFSYLCQIPRNPLLIYI